jgi:hypothetical protein
MSNKKETVMQDLREDLVASIDSAKEALSGIENQVVRSACQEVARLTLKQIINRIDDELLEKEKQQIIDAYYYDPNCDKIKDDGEQYYRKNFKDKEL